MMMPCGGDTAMMLPPMPGSSRLEYSSLCVYRDAIRRVSVSGGLCRRSAQFFLPISSDAVGEESDCSSVTSASSSVRCSPVYLSSPDEGLFFSAGRGHVAPDEELRAIALQMVDDGYMKPLIQAFSSVGSSSAHYYDRGLATHEVLLTSWFSELDVDWVWGLHTGEDGDMVQQMADGRCVSLQDLMGKWILPLKTLMREFSLQDLMERWIRALKIMAQVLSLTPVELSATKAPTVGGVRNAIIRYFLISFSTGRKTKHEQDTEHFVRFAEASILRMLTFLDAVAAAALNDHLAPDTLHGMLLLYTCILDDSSAVLAVFKEACSAKFDGMSRVFTQKREKLSDAIWSTMETVRNSFLIDDSWHASWTTEVEGVHKNTKLMMNYITLLSSNEGALNFVLKDQRRVKTRLPQPSSVVDLIKDTISCLERQVEKASNSISEPGLRYVFLMNNFSFISQKVSSFLLPSFTPFEDDYSIHSRSMKRDSRGRILSMENYVNQPDPNLPREIEMDSNLDGLVRIQKYIQAYLDASWDPVLSCLYLPYGGGLQGFSGALAKFESEFHRTYAQQQQWKVPNPELRKRLRQAVIDKVISGYSMYLAERRATGKSKRSMTSRTPHVFEEQLKELFEG